MAITKRSTDFFESEEGVKIKQALRLMASDASYNTVPSYSANSAAYPDNRIPFVDKHLNYLRMHPAIDAQYYISNLRLMTRIK